MFDACLLDLHIGLHNSLWDGFQSHPNLYRLQDQSCLKCHTKWNSSFDSQITWNTPSHKTRTRREFKGRDLDIPLILRLLFWPFSFFLHDLGRVWQVLLVYSKWWMEHPPQILCTIILPTRILSSPRISHQTLVSLTLNRNKHTQLVAWVRSDYLMRCPSPWPYPKSPGICSECKLGCILVLFCHCSISSLPLQNRKYQTEWKGRVDWMDEGRDRQ